MDSGTSEPFPLYNKGEVSIAFTENKKMMLVVYPQFQIYLPGLHFWGKKKRKKKTSAFALTVM